MVLNLLNRAEKGAPLNATEHDVNFTAIEAAVNVIGFKGGDLASAGTVDLGLATGDYVDITGVTAITSFGTAAAGIERTVRFTGILTLTYNVTSMILPYGVSIVTAAGDTAIFRSLGGGNWLCVHYQRAGAARAHDDVHVSWGTIASAATTDLGAAAGNYGIISGTTTITALGTAANGVPRIARFTGILTLTHNATSLILPVGVNITTAVGDVASFMSLGAGNWRCIGYTPASGAALVGVSNIQVSGQSDVVPSYGAGDIEFVSGSNITLTTNAATRAITIASAAGGIGFSDLWKVGTGAPSPSADFVGQFYIDTTPTPDAVYQARGPSVGNSSADWSLITDVVIGTNGDILSVVGGVEAWVDLPANAYYVKNNADAAGETRTDKRTYGVASNWTAAGTYQLPPWPNIPGTAVDVQAHTWGGTCTIQITKNGAAIQNFTSAQAQTTSVSTQTSTETFTKGNKMALVIASPSTLTGVCVMINYLRTGN